MAGQEDTLASRDLVLKEITDTVKYLLLKKAQGTETVELEDLLDKKLEQNILVNFEGLISIPEYENVVKKLF